MSLRRIRKGELLVLLGLLGLIVSLFLRWFDIDFELDDVLGAEDGPHSAVSADAPAGWRALGDPWLEFLVVAGSSWIAVLVLALRSGRGRSTYGALVALVLAIPITALVLLLTAVRTLLASPSLSFRDLGASGFGGLERLGDTTAVSTFPAIGTWVGLASLVIGVVGLWVALADDRTSAAESATEPPPASPIPEPRPVASDQAPPVA